MNDPVTSEWPISNSFHVLEETFPSHGDASLFDISQFIMPTPPQTHITQPNATLLPHPQMCPECGGEFGRRQERDRHLRLLFPRSFHCPSQNCPWRSDRSDNFIHHWTKKHPNGGPAPERLQIQTYDADLLAKLVGSGSMTVESAADVALSLVEWRMWELGKVGVWANWWDRRKKCKPVRSRM
ncbi:hypothetical protein BJV74DRAFT_846041, partial [Russula compacta]